MAIVPDRAQRRQRESHTFYQKADAGAAAARLIPTILSVLSLSAMVSRRTMQEPAGNASEMIYFLTSQSLWLSGAILVGLGTALSMLGPSLVRRYVTLERLTANNEIAGFKYATLGVLYAVFLAFAIIVVWQKFSDAEADVVQEAGAATTIYRLSQGMDEKSGADIRHAVTAYLKVAIADDWPAMDHGVTGASRTARQALDAIYAALLSSEPAERTGNPVMTELLHQLDAMTQARRSRLIAAEGSVPGIIWLVLFGGAVVAIVFTFFFGTRNLQAQVMMTGLLAVMIFAELLIIVAIDRPFTGSVKVEPAALADVLAEFDADSGRK
jgi:hypothetical protein